MMKYLTDFYNNILYGRVYGAVNREDILAWVSTTASDAHTLSSRALVAGHDNDGKGPLWVIRANHEGNLIPGKLAIQCNAAYVPWDGRANVVHNIEVCCVRNDEIRWEQSRDGVVPLNAIAAGYTSTGEKLYIGRVHKKGSCTPGKVHPSHKSMYVPYGGKEVAHKDYEILCSAG